MFDPILYQRGVPSDHFTLILSGKVMVYSGHEGFMITQSSFNYLGDQALTRDDFKPDFSAKVVENSRILRITREKYREALSSLQQTKNVQRRHYGPAGIRQPKYYEVSQPINKQ